MTIGKTTEQLKYVFSKAVRDALKDSLSGDSYFIFTAYTSDSDYPLKDSDLSDIVTEAQIDINYSNMLTAHKVLPGGISRVIPRNNWVRNNNYTAWTRTSNANENSNFYVVATEVVSGTVRQNVYKCLYAPFGVTSTTPPTGDSATPVQTGDGYIWQYMYTISQSEALRFLTERYIPVPERVTEDEAPHITVGTTRYLQLAVQNNTLPGTVFNVTGNPSFDTVVDYLNGDSDSIRANGINVTMRDGLGRDSEIVQTFAGTLKWNGTVWYSELTTYGIGYTGQPIVYGNDSDLSSFFTAHIAPDFGHGNDAPTELNASNVMLITRNVPEDNFFQLATNDVRMIGLLKNPIDANTSNIALKNYYTVAHRIVPVDTTELSNIEEDWIVKSDGIKIGRVLALSTNELWAIIDSPSQRININQNLSFQHPEGGVEPSFDVKEYYTPEIIWDSGQVLMVDYRGPTGTFSRAQDQIESLNVVLKF